MTPLIVLVIFALLAVGMAIVAGVMASAQPRRGESPEDDGAAFDAGVRHECWHCGVRISGPEDGFRIPDCECWACHCARYVPGDNEPTVGAWVRKPVGKE